MKKLKIFLVSVLALFTLTPAMMPAVAAAQTSSANNVACGVQGDIGGTTECSATDVVGADSKINGIITTAIRIFQVIVGLVAVVMVVVGGLKYITSGGDAANVSAAKSTILYAIVGIVVVALAEIVVQFVLNRAINAGTDNF